MSSFKCKKRIRASGIDYICLDGNRKPVKGICKPVNQTEGLGVSILGSGGNVNLTKTKLACIDKTDVERALKEKYGY